MLYFLLSLNALVMVLLPLALGVFLYRRYGAGWRFFFIGAVAFIGAQVVHIPFNQFVLNPLLAPRLEGSSDFGTALFVAILFGLSAGLFESIARYIAFRTGAKDARIWRDGMMVGAGHGGIEAIIIGLLAALTPINAYLIQSGALDAVLAEQGAETLALAQAQIETLLATPRWQLLLGAAERFFALSMHLAASLLVLQAVRRRNLLWLLAAIGLHAAVDTFAGLVIFAGWDVLWVEGILAGFAMVSWILIVWLKRREADENGDDEAALPGATDDSHQPTYEGV